VKIKKLFLACFMLFVSIFLTVSAFASEIVLEDLDGNKTDIASLPKPAIIFFWTTWCPYCRQELKQLNQQFPQIKKDAITVVAVNIGESGNKVGMFLKDYGIDFKVFLDKDSVAADKYGIIGVPTYVFITASGKVISDRHNLPADYKTLLTE